MEENEETGNDAAEFVFPDIISEVLGITREREYGFVSATVLGEWRNCDSKSLCRRFRCVQGEGELSLEVVLRGSAYRDWETDRKSTRLNSSHSGESRMPSSA